MTRGFSGLLTLAPEVERALIRSQPVVALETSLVAHGLPQPLGVDVAEQSEQAVRDNGAVPATIAVIDGTVRVGIGRAELERLAGDGQVRKIGPRDLAAGVISGDLGATTVAGTLAVCRIAGIHFMATGGIGGVHRGWQQSMDISADMNEVGGTAVVRGLLGRQVAARRACHARAAGEQRRSRDRLRHRHVPALLPARERPAAGRPLDDPATVARVAATHWGFARTTGVLVANPIAEEAALAADEVEPWIEEALAEAEAGGVTGSAVTPFVLGRLHERSNGRTLEATRG